jgi:hypothetical protein
MPVSVAACRGSMGRKWTFAQTTDTLRTESSGAQNTFPDVHMVTPTDYYTSASGHPDPDIHCSVQPAHPAEGEALQEGGGEVGHTKLEVRVELQAVAAVPAVSACSFLCICKFFTFRKSHL